ncbi:MAG: hypothetical protein DRJ42_18225 [Deltaproteobacteria bacterium]|nr:MAG: hypothetical protein DRJ42_18225 [Deltaproteobacteria bacterium]
MRRALRASRAVAFVVAQFIYLAFEEAVKAGAQSQPAVEPRVIPSVHERKTLPGTFTAPRLDLDVDFDVDVTARAPRVRIIDSSVEAAATEVPSSEASRELQEALPAVLRDVAREPLAPLAPTEVAADAQEVVVTLLRTLRQDVGCTTRADESHRACRAATKLSTFIDRDAVLEALEETVTQARRPHCVRTSAIDTLGQAKTGRAGRAIARMVGVARGRLAWTGSRVDREVLALLLRALDV